MCCVFLFALPCLACISVQAFEAEILDKEDHLTTHTSEVALPYLVHEKNEYKKKQDQSKALQKDWYFTQCRIAVRSIFL